MFILGDIHGNFSTIVNFCRKNISKEPLNLIQVGDFGAGFRKDFLDDMLYLNDVLNEYNVTLYVIRGNHDDPKFFNGNHNWGNLKLLKDYTVLDLEGKKILLIGGAISIDRGNRIEGSSWWEDEKFILNDDEIKNINNINIVITHTAPNFIHSTEFNGIVKFYIQYDKNLSTELINERNDLTVLYEKLIKNNEINHWFYGHFHSYNTETYNNTTFTLLNVDEFYNLN